MTTVITKPRPRLLRNRAITDRRASTRFPVELELRYSRGTKQVGRGRTRDMSSTGISFSAENFLPLGLELTISIDWPVRLSGGAGLQLITDATVVRSVAGVIAVRIGRTEFKTRRAQ